MDNEVCQWQVGGFLQGTPVSSTNKTDCHDVTEILLKVALNTINSFWLSSKGVDWPTKYKVSGYTYF
jgi:hypothetical protein